MKGYALGEYKDKRARSLLILAPRPSPTYTQGFVKGYALVEYKDKREAQAAIDAMNGQPILDKTVHVDWGFKKGATKRR